MRIATTDTERKALEDQIRQDGAHLIVRGKNGLIMAVETRPTRAELNAPRAAATMDSRFNDDRIFVTVIKDGSLDHHEEIAH